MTEAREAVEREYDPCPLCKQYSHSINDDKVAEAFNHFHTLIAHPSRGHPMGEAFDEKTRDAAQVLTHLAQAGLALQDEGAEERITDVLAQWDPSEEPTGGSYQAQARAILDSLRKSDKVGG